LEIETPRVKTLGVSAYEKGEEIKEMCPNPTTS
jgi:hypothetical protein